MNIDNELESHNKVKMNAFVFVGDPILKYCQRQRPFMMDLCQAQEMKMF